MRMLDTEFEALAREPTSLAPADLRARIDETLDAIYEPFNNGVYRAGFATTQAAYEAAPPPYHGADFHAPRVTRRVMGR